MAFTDKKGVIHPIRSSSDYDPNEDALRRAAPGTYKRIKAARRRLKKVTRRRR